MKALERLLTRCMSAPTLTNFMRKPDINGKKKKTGRSKNLMPQDERKLAHEFRKSSRSTVKTQNQVELTCVSRQTVFNCIMRRKKFIFKKWKHYPK